MILFIIIHANIGSKSSKLGDDMRIKLKAVYSLVESLYIGAQRAITAALYKKKAPSFVKEVFERLPVLPQRVEELKRSVSKSGDVTALSWAKAWQAELDPEEIATGFPV